MEQKQVILIAVLAIALAVGFIFALNAYRINFTGEVIKVGSNSCLAENFSVVDASECKAKCLIIGSEEFDYKPEKGYGLCTCLKELC